MRKPFCLLLYVLGILPGILPVQLLADDVILRSDVQPAPRIKAVVDTPPPSHQSSSVNKPEKLVRPPQTDEQHKAVRISIIIDDMGYRFKQGKRALKLPAKVTYSFLPYAPYSRQLAVMANQHDKELMLHIPMEADNGKKLGPGGLTTHMPQDIFQLELKHTLTAIPNIKGMNNHMGSSLTRLDVPMNWLMQSLAKENKYFIDSRTTNDSVALKVAREYNIRSETRDVFLDHDLNKDAIRKQLDEVVKVARRNGSAIAIGHPFDETLSVLEHWLPQMQSQGIKFVYVSELISLRQQWREQLAESRRLQLVKKDAEEVAHEQGARTARSGL